MPRSDPDTCADRSFPRRTSRRFEAIDEIDHVVEPAAGATTDAASRNGDGKMRLAGAGPADQRGVALGDEPAAGEVVDERLVDRGALKREVGEILSERQLGDGELLLDRARLLLADLGVEQIADDALGFVLTFDGAPLRRAPGLRASTGT
jgi:hypothetical protein